MYTSIALRVSDVYVCNTFYDYTCFYNVQVLSVLWFRDFDNASRLPNSCFLLVLQNIELHLPLSLSVGLTLSLSFSLSMSVCLSVCLIDWLSPSRTTSIFLLNLATNYSKLYILRDFNLHLDIHSSITTMFDDILTPFDLKQHLIFSTYIHWLYL